MGAFLGATYARLGLFNTRKVNTMTDFDFGDGPVPAHQHPNGLGWVADTATVEVSAYVGPDAQVYENAQVCGNARVYGDARVCGDVWGYDKLRLEG